MSNYIVNQGDCLASIAKNFGFRDWKVIYDHPKNSEFKKKRSNPNVLYPGDKIFIPDKKRKEESCAANQTHKFKISTKEQKTFLRIVLKDDQGKFLDGKKYALRIKDPDGREDLVYDGKVGEKGKVEQEIPANAQEGELTVSFDDSDSNSGVTWPLKIGHLDPIDEVSGIKARLNSLGFPCGPEDGELNEQLSSSVSEFQSAKGLTVTGKIDSDFKKKLSQTYGC